MGTLNVGFLGCGRVAERHMEVFRDEIRGARVVAVCDQVRERADRRAAQLGATPLYRMEELLLRPDIDVIDIMTESGVHARHARAALEAGKHVIVEKPAALSPEEILELGEFARRQGRMYAVIYQNRYNPAMRALKGAFEGGRFGKLVLATIRLRWCRPQEYYEDGWHGTWGMDGGVINQQAIHHLDALQWVCGAVDSVVSAQGNRMNRLEAEDTTVAAVRFANGGLGVIEATTAARPRDFEASISIVGEKGMAVIGGIALNKVETWQFLEARPEDEGVAASCSQEVPTGYGLSHGPFIQDIVNRLLESRLDPPVDFTAATASVRLVHALYRSHELGGWTCLKDEPRSERLGKT